LKYEYFSYEIQQGIFLGRGIEAAISSTFEHHCRLPVGILADGFSLQNFSILLLKLLPPNQWALCAFSLAVKRQERVAGRSTAPTVVKV
jgi:hypothetical protein